MATRFFNDDGQTYAYLDTGKLVLTDAASCHFESSGQFDLSGNLDLLELPDGLCVDRLFLRGCARLARLPERLHVKFLSAPGCSSLEALPGGLSFDTLNLRGTGVKTLPDDLSVVYRLDLSDCRELTDLPVGLRVGLKGVPRGTPTLGSLILRNCASLEFLPDDLDVCHVDISGCTKLIGWRDGATARVDRLFARGCSRLSALPPRLSLSRLEISDCVNLRYLPPEIRVSTQIELANTGLTDLPHSLRNARLTWRGVTIDHKIAFHPECITVEEILTARNSELRRVLLERFGLERFITQANAQVLDVDRDAGGERRLLRVPIEGDEDLVCVLVNCPSTGRRYILRVPPTMKTCRAAIAWTAGFSDPDLYRPVVET